MRFIDSYFPLLFAAPPSDPILHPDIKRAFGHLRRFIASHMKVHEKETEDERLIRITAAREELLAFARLCYQVCKGLQGVCRGVGERSLAMSMYVRTAMVSCCVGSIA